MHQPLLRPLRLASHILLPHTPPPGMQLSMIFANVSEADIIAKVLAGRTSHGASCCISACCS